MSQSAHEGRDLRIAIIGAGASGLCMGIRLKQAGFEDFVLLEQADALGGTWYHNRYPGCACDLDRCQTGTDGSLQRRDPTRDRGRQRLERGLQRLLPKPQRQDRDPVAVLDE